MHSIDCWGPGPCVLPWEATVNRDLQAEEDTAVENTNVARMKYCICNVVS